MRARIDRRARRQREHERIAFLPDDATIGAHEHHRAAMREPGASTAERFPPTCSASGSRAPAPPPGRARATAESIRNVAYALLSGADGWMFDGEDALGQVDSMSLDNQRNLRLAFERADVFMAAAERVAGEMNAWAQGFLGRPIIAGLADAARLHDADLPRARPAPRRSARAAGERRVALGVDRRPGALCRRQSRALRARRPQRRALPAEDPDRRGSGALERHAGRARAPSRPAAWRRSRSTCWSSSSRRRFQLMEIRAALGAALRRLQHRPLGLHQQRLGRGGVGSGVRQPEHRRDHDDVRLHARLRGSRAPRGEHAGSQRAASRSGRAGWSRTSRSGSPAGVQASMARAVAGAEREQREGASGKWVAHWKMVHIVRPVWEKVGRAESARPSVSAADVHDAGRRRADAARARAAHRSAARAI